MKHTFFAVATAMLMAPLAACGDNDGQADLQSLSFPDGMEVIVWEPPSTSASVDLRADEMLGDHAQGISTQDMLDAMGGRHNGSGTQDMLDAIGQRTAAPEAQDSPIGHQSKPAALSRLDSESTTLPAPVVHGDSPELADDDDLYNAPADLPQTGDDYNTSLPLEDPCMCEGQQCLTDWIDSNVGCDVCVAFMCGQNTIGACAVCPVDENLGQ